MSHPHAPFFSSLVLSLGLLCTFCAGPAHAQRTGAVRPDQPDVQLTLGGTLQPRFSYGHLSLDDASDDRDRVGFGVRRARLRVGATVEGRTGAYVQLGAAGASVELLDALVFYDLTDALRLRLGRFTPAQPRAFQPTSHTRIDLVARAAIARRWGSGTLANGGRDFGLEALYETDRFDAQATVHNGNGSWDRALGNFREDNVGDPTGDGDTRGLAAGLYGAWRPAALPGVEVGGFAGYNAARNGATRPPGDLRPAPLFDQTRPYASYATHLYWGARPGSQPVRLKGDLIGTRYETLTFDGPAFPEQPRELEQHALGASLLGAVGFLDGSAEVLARFERYDPALGRDGDAVDYLSAGVSISPSALRGRAYRRQRLTLAYSTQDPVGAAPRAHLLVLQAQIVF